MYVYQVFVRIDDTLEMNYNRSNVSIKLLRNRNIASYNINLNTTVIIWTTVQAKQKL